MSHSRVKLEFGVMRFRLFPIDWRKKTPMGDPWAKLVKRSFKSEADIKKKKEEKTKCSNTPVVHNNSENF